tara:strand:+ start:1046 stop:1372 length:327 start_codon:yes stop_codon:yes gene_type:complete
MAIQLTASASKHVKSFIKGTTDSYLRLAVKPAGCSGFMYEVSVSDSVNDQDIVFQTGGVSVLVDKESLKYLDGSTVDFTREGLNQGFRFSNPNAVATCGCGESFTLDG